MGNEFNKNELTIISGDDYSFFVEFEKDDQPCALAEGDTVEFVIHTENNEIIISPQSANDYGAVFYLSPELTTNLLAPGINSIEYSYCVRIRWASGGRCTPIHREKFRILRC